MIKLDFRWCGEVTSDCFANLQASVLKSLNFFGSYFGLVYLGAIGMLLNPSLRYFKPFLTA